MASHLARDIEPLIREMQDDIYAVCRYMNFEPSWQQWDYLQAVQIATKGFPSPSRPQISSRANTENLGKPWVVVKSGQGPGKTSASGPVANFRLVQGPGAPVFVTAPTMHQCRGVWLKEYGRMMEGAHPLLRRYFQKTKSRVIVANDDAWGIEFVPAARAMNAQGRHHPLMTWIADEMAGIPRELCVQIEGTLSNMARELGDELMNGMFIGTGNPNIRDCYFYDCFNQDRENWWTYTMNAEESPPHIVSPARNEKLALKYGRDSDIYRVRVLGEFPHSDPNTVMSSEDLEACTRTDPDLCRSYGLHEQYGIVRPILQIGIDFARFGGDENTVYFREGNTIVHWEKFLHTDPNDVLDHVFRLRASELCWKESDPYWVFDAGGLGQGLARRVHRAAGDGKVLEFHSGSTITQSRDHYDKITEAFFTMAHLVKNRMCRIPNDNRLIQQLSTRQYEMADKRGKSCLRLESKEQYVKRVMRDQGVDTRGQISPDRADGCVMAFYPCSPAEGRVLRRAG